METFTCRIGLIIIGLAASVACPRVTLALEATSDVALHRGPRFFLTSSPKATPVRLDVKRTPVLSRRISLDLREVRLEEALATIAQQAGLKLSYSTALVQLDQRARLVAQDITVAGAISELLFDVDVDVMFTTSGQAVLVRRTAAGGPRRPSRVNRPLDYQ